MRITILRAHDLEAAITYLGHNIKINKALHEATKVNAYICDTY
jgi:hypothetical protein